MFYFNGQITGQPLIQWKLMLECRTQELASPVEKEIADLGYDSLSSRSLPTLSITQITGMANQKIYIIFYKLSSRDGLISSDSFVLFLYF